MSNPVANQRNDSAKSEIKKLTVGEVIFLILRGLLAAVVIGGLLHLSGVYQLSLYRKTPAGVRQATPAGHLNAPLLRLPLTVFILASAGDYGSQRSRSDAERLVKNAGRIWQQANIEISVKRLTILPIGDEYLTALPDNPAALISRLEGYDPKTINVLLVRSLNGINGVAFRNWNAVAVADYTTVYDFRVLAHEVGHILGLAHAAGDRGRLMYRGVNGFSLSPSEITKARVATRAF